MRSGGVGRRLTEKLNALGINTALQLAQANTAFIRKNFSVILERTVRELNGESCISPGRSTTGKTADCL
ncbi:protein ImpB [Escherichia coli T426]|nr:protein ImpB [Escherichia coli T426]